MKRDLRIRNGGQADAGTRDGGILNSMIRHGRLRNSLKRNFLKTWRPFSEAAALCGGFVLLSAVFLAGCHKADASRALFQGAQAQGAESKLMIAAAASLERVMEEELLPAFQEKYPAYTEISATYDSSGKLMTQIEEGAETDVFFSAAQKQMDRLTDKGLIGEDSVEKVVENEIVLIVPAGEESGYTQFQDIVKAGRIAVGDPDSVPAGQYAKEALENLGIWEDVLKKASLGTNVTEVVNWVAEGSADAGTVYATDALTNDRVTVIAPAPEGSVRGAVYPAGVAQGSANREGAYAFVRFLKSEEAQSILEKNGFTRVRDEKDAE